jgi:anaerobic selenocysteine-containing dehydrogenase
MEEPAVRRSFCRFCYALCGIEATVQDGRVLSVEGDRSHPVSRGYTCPKGRALGAYHNHPARLDHPLGRRDGALRRVSWSEQLDDLARGIGRAMDVAGPSAFAVYRGTAGYFDSAAAGLDAALLKGVGSRSFYSTLTVDAAAATLVAELVAGHPWLFPVPDLASRMTVLIGTNPMFSHGHTFSMPRPKERLRTWARQGQLWVIDPRRTETAEVATAHLAPRAGSDYLLLAHLVRELLADRAGSAYLRRHAAGLDELAAAVQPFDLDRVVDGTGLRRDDVLAFIDAVVGAGRVAFATGTGLTFSEAGNVAVWLAWTINAITESLDRPGGMWFNPGYLTQRDAESWEPSLGMAAPGPASRPELPGRFDQLPSVALAGEIEAGHVRALLVLGGNPLVALPDPDRTARALAALDVLAVVDVIHNEVVELATHALPAAGQLERDDIHGIDFLGVEGFGQYAEAVVPPAAERRPAWWIVAQLAERLGVSLPGGPDADSTDGTVLRALYGADAERWTALREAHSAVIAPSRPFGWVHDKLPDGRWRLAPAMLVDQLGDLAAPDPMTLSLTPRRQRRKLNSQLSDGHRQRIRPRAEALLHPDDGAELGVRDGQEVVVSSPSGRLRLPARIDARAATRGIVSVPHGFVAANVARLISADAVDPLTGMPRLTGVPVTVTSADGERPSRLP